MWTRLLDHLSEQFPEPDVGRQARALLVTGASYGGIVLGMAAAGTTIAVIGASGIELPRVWVSGLIIAGLAVIALVTLWQGYLVTARRIMSLSLGAGIIVVTVLPLQLSAGVLGLSVLVGVVLAATFLPENEFNYFIGMTVGTIFLSAVLRLTGVLELGTTAPAVLVIRLITAAGVTVVVGLIMSQLLRDLYTTASEAEQRAQQLELLTSLTSMTEAFISVESMLSNYLARLRNTLELAEVSASVLDEGGEQIVMQGSTSDKETVFQPVELPVMPRSVIGQAVIRRSPVNANQLDEALTQLPNRVEQWAWPMINDDVVVGVLIVTTYPGQQLTDEARAVIAAIANQFAIQIYTLQTVAIPASMLDATNPIFRATRIIAGLSDPYTLADHIAQDILPGSSHISVLQASTAAGGTSSINHIYSNNQSVHQLTLAEVNSLVNALIPARMVWISDMTTSSDMNANLKNLLQERLQARCVAIIPVRSHGITTGSILALSNQPGGISEDDVRTLYAINNELSVVLRQAALLGELEHQSERLSLINQLTQELTGVLDMEAISATVLKHLRTLVHPTHLGVITLDASLRNGVSHTISGVTLPDRLRLPGSPIQAVLDERAAMQLMRGVDWPSDTFWQDVSVQSLLLIPMIARDQQIGALTVGLANTTALPEDDLLLLEQVGEQVGVAIDNYRLFDRLQASLEESNTLYSTSLAMNAAQSLDEVIETLMGELSHLSNADTIELYLAGPDARSHVDFVELFATWQSQNTALHMEKTRYSLNKAPILAQFPQSRANLIFNDLQNDKRLDDDIRNRYAERGVNALVMIPISTGTIWLGALMIEGQAGDVFTSDQVRLCRNVTDQAALAIDSQMLLDRTAMSAIREQSLRSLISEIRDANTVEDIRLLTIGELVRILGLPAPDIEELLGGGGIEMVSSDDYDFVQNIRAQMDLAIANLSLLRSMEQNTRREQMISDMTSQLQRATNVDEVMRTTVRTLNDLLNNYDVKLSLAGEARSDFVEDDRG